MISKTYANSVIRAEVPRTGQLGAPVAPVATPQLQTGAAKSDFQKILDQKTGSLNFSAHAVKRLSQRNISLSETDMTRLSSAVDKASCKGARESLVLLDNMAFVVSVSNRTVITAMDPDGMKENVVTHIDSAVIA